ncbi:MAG: hypothetical protein IJB00_05675 [Akkermansia sp.]|nr:hypothetical protein [Akkermansia sp.]
MKNYLLPLLLGVASALCVGSRAEALPVVPETALVALPGAEELVAEHRHHCPPPRHHRRRHCCHPPRRHRCCPPPRRCYRGVLRINW